MILLRPADMLVASVVLLSLTSLTHASVPCNDGFVEYECADQYPVCCTWKVNDVIAACCPPSATCDLSEGFCIVHHVVNNRSTTPPPQTPSQGGITVAVSEAAAFITFGAIGFIIAVVGCAFLAFKVFIMAQAYRQRRQQEEYERVLQASGSEEDDDAADGKEEDGGDDEEGQCTLCFSHRMNCVLLPCAHVCTCRACASKLSQCPLCRSEIKSFRPFKNRIYIRSAKPIADVPAPAVEPRRNDDAPVVVTVPTSARRAAAAAPAAVDSARCASEELTPTPRVALDTTPRMPISARARPVTLATDDDDEASGRLRIAASTPSAVAQIAEQGAADQTDDDPSTCSVFDAVGHHLQDASVAAEAAQREGAPSPAVEDI